MNRLTRRQVLAATATGFAASAAPATPNPFPKGFLFGVATAAHQVEGNNTNSDSWVVEHVKPTIYAEGSNDACDHYHRYADDIKLVASLGFNIYRFSIEWARIEPEPGLFSIAELDHYRRMLAACHEHKLIPVVTLHHFTAPRWFAAQGGWENDDSTDLFVRYAERTAKHLGDMIGIGTTFNEPNIPFLIRWMNLGGALPMEAMQGMIREASRVSGSSRFNLFMFGDAPKQRDTMIAAHGKALAAMKSCPGKYPVGVNLAMHDEQAVGPDSGRDRKRAEVYAPWLAAAANSDYVGVQTYTRGRVGPDKDLGPAPGVELTQMGYEFWPEALEQTI